VNERPLTFFSSTAERAEDGAVLIALFDGGKKDVALLRCSVDAGINLIAAVAGCLVNDAGAEPRDAQ
jgi:hypothetical protein